MFRSSFLSLVVIVLFTAVSGFAAGRDGVWKHVELTKDQMEATGNGPHPVSFEAFSLDRPTLEKVLSGASEEFSDGRETIISVPLPDGTLGRFRIEHSLVVEPGLLTKYPELGATYRGYGIDDPTASIRFDLMPKGFHAMILRGDDTLR